MNFLEGLIYQIGTKKKNLTNFKPPNRRPTSPTIQGFIRSHGYEWMETIIISNSNKGKCLSQYPLKLNIQALRIFSRVWIVRFTWTSIWEWKAVLSFTLVPNPYRNDLQNLDVNCAPRCWIIEYHGDTQSHLWISLHNLSPNI